MSYLSQHYRIIARRSSEGISPYFVLLGTTGGTCALSNILVLPASRADIACCKEVGEFECFAGLLGILQVALQWSCFAIMYFSMTQIAWTDSLYSHYSRLLLFLLFFPNATSISPTKASASTPSFRTALIVAGICVLHGFLTAILNIVIINKNPDALQSYANVLGILATVLASIQYLPQLYTTFKLKAVGSLSIPMMCIQTPGSFLWAGSLAARVGWVGWSTWFVYVVTGILQGGVLGMGIFFELRNRKMRKNDDIGETNHEDNVENEGEIPAQEAHETSPLLISEH